LAILAAMFAAILNIMPSKTVLHKWKTTVKLSEYSECPLTSNDIKIIPKSIYYNRRIKLALNPTKIDTKGFSMDSGTIWHAK